MASFLYLCNRCAAVMRFMEPQETNEHIICDSCKARIEENEEAAQKAKAKEKADREAEAKAKAKSKSEEKRSDPVPSGRYSGSRGR